MDGKAYCSEEVWQAILDETGWNPIYLRDRRYDAVLHMVTAADGAERYYTGANNEARYENIEDAQIVDRKLQGSWIGHPHYHIITNAGTKGFDHKITLALNKVLSIIGLPKFT